jgi:hypothetical protein
VSRPSVVLLVWAGMLAALGLLLLGWTTKPLLLGLLFGAAALTAILAVLAWRGRAPERRVVPDVSVATVLVALGLALLVTGTAFGLWLILIGAGISVVGLVAVARERL